MIHARLESTRELFEVLHEEHVEGARRDQIMACSRILSHLLDVMGQNTLDDEVRRKILKSNLRRMSALRGIAYLKQRYIGTLKRKGRPVTTRDNGDFLPIENIVDSKETVVLHGLSVCMTVLTT